MPGRIPQTFIDDLLNRVDIVDIIDSELPLKKTGRDYQALCPFHGEKTPSFTVSQEKQFYHCFGCGAHGSALGFLMNHRGLSFVEAIEEAASSVGLEVPREEGTQTPKIDYSPLYEILERAQKYFAEQLKTHSDRDRAVAYLKSRGLSGLIAKQFGIGFAPDSWDGLMSALGTDDQAVQRLIQAGLVIENDQKRRYDRFRDRITFPIHDRRGRVVAFGGRVIDKGEPKYLNSPETPVFQKRRELYGLYQVRRSDQNVSRVLVVEGYMDVVALAQFTVNNAVASLGTATTTEQLETLFKTAPEVVFCYDGDAAGRRAAWRALETALPLIHDGRQAGFIFVPGRPRPRQFCTRTRPRGVHRTRLDQTLVRVPPRRIGQKDGSKLYRRSRAIYRSGRTNGQENPTRIVPPTTGPTDRGNRRSGPARISCSGRWNSTPGPQPARRAQRRGRPSMVKQALKRLLFDPKLANLVVDYAPIAGLPDENAGLLAELLELIGNRPNLTTGALVEHYRDTPHAAILEQPARKPARTR